MKSLVEPDQTEACCDVAAGHRGVRPLPAVLRLHRPDGDFLLAANGHDWLLRRLHVHQEDLRRRQDRLRLRRCCSPRFLIFHVRFLYFFYFLLLFSEH